CFSNPLISALLAATKAVLLCDHHTIWPEAAARGSRVVAWLREAATGMATATVRIRARATELRRRITMHLLLGNRESLHKLALRPACPATVYVCASAPPLLGRRRCY